MASAPDLARASHAANPVRERADAARLISLEEARSNAFRASWRTLADQACEPNPYLEEWFVLPSLDAFANQRSLPSLLVHYSGDELVGLLPVGKSTRYYGYPVPHWSTWVHDNTFCGAPLVRTGYEERFWRAALACIDETTRSALFFHLPHLPLEGPLHCALVKILTHQGRPSASVASETRAMLASDLSPQDYLAASLSTKKRKELRRQRKRLSEEGELAFERSNDDAGVDDWVSDFLTLEAAGWKGDAGSALASSGSTRGFFAATLKGAARAGKLERLALRLDGRPIAMLANFLTAPGAYSFKTAFDERYSRYSPGMLLQLENLKVLCRDDIAWSDSCAAEGHPMIEHLWRERRTLTSTNIAIGGSLRRGLFGRLMAYETRRRSAP